MKLSDKTITKKNMVFLFREFCVHDEQELYNKLVAESNNLPCLECGLEFPIEKIYFLDGDPYCYNCIKKYK
jgi:hypothetical protein